MATPDTPTPNTPTKGYGKRPIWQWVVIYLIIGAVVYGLIYYFFMRDSGSGDTGIY